MKNSVTIACRKCGWEKDFYFGVGLLHRGAVDFDSEHALLPRFVKDQKALGEIRRAVEGGAQLETEYRFALYRCPDCGAFYKRFEYSLMHADGSEEKPAYACDCGGILEKIDLEDFCPEAYPCPACGEMALAESVSMLMPDFD
ncbi:MAG: hypothetical protein Q4C55_01190 [Eubacterium sp.]|nr:hypothetical protein [Eubacterium sp.]